MQTRIKESENQEFWFVYLLKCADGRIYTGCTFNNRYEALKFEKYLKRHFVLVPNFFINNL